MTEVTASSMVDISLSLCYPYAPLSDKTVSTKALLNVLDAALRKLAADLYGTFSGRTL